MSVERWQNFIKFMMRRLLLQKFNVTYIYENIEPDISAPYLVIGNHVTTYDPFFLSLGLKESVRFVTSDLYFRNPILAYFAKKVGCIPKAKFVTDVSIARTLLQCKNQDESVGIYPEGYRDWDGTTDQFAPSTAKLIKILKIPVVAVVTKGGYLTMPRWSSYRRKGKIFLQYKKILTEEQITDLTWEEIHQIITDALYHSDNEWNRKESLPYIGKRMAETLERMLYCCPNCGNFESLSSKDDRLKCNVCGYEVTYDEYGFFTASEDQTLYFDDPYAWKIYCEKTLKKYITDKKDTAILFERIVRLRREKNKGSLFRTFDKGRMMIYKDRMEFTGKRHTIIFALDRITGLNSTKKNMLDFYYENVKYRIDPQNLKVSGLLWENCYQILTQKDQVEVC